MYYFVLGTMAPCLSCELSSSGQTTVEVVIPDLNCTERDSAVCLCFCFLFKTRSCYEAQTVIKFKILLPQPFQHCADSGVVACEVPLMP